MNPELYYEVSQFTTKLLDQKLELYSQLSPAMKKEYVLLWNRINTDFVEISQVIGDYLPLTTPLLNYIGEFANEDES